MSKKQQQKTVIPKQNQQSESSQSPNIAVPMAQIKQNHLSSSYELILKYEQKNYEIEQLTNTIQVSREAIQAEMKESLVPSSFQGEQIFKKYGSMIQNQPIFLKELIFHKYLPYLPEKFQNEFSQVILTGTVFEAVWWGSLAIFIINGIRNRHADVAWRQRIKKGVGFGALMIVGSLGFHNNYYLPSLKNCYYKNIRSIDALMDRHMKLLRSHGADINNPHFINQSQSIPKPQFQSQNKQITPNKTKTNTQPEVQKQQQVNKKKI